MCEVEVAAFGAPRLSHGNVRGGPPPITKDLVQGRVKEMVAEQKPTPVESRSNTGNSGIAARRRAGKRLDRARDHE